MWNFESFSLERTFEDQIESGPAEPLQVLNFYMRALEFNNSC